ncbi:MAG: YybH family protein [Gemmatimonas sp.]|uniref:YybH family protein n=1 Tax=Gemmatimonas sp. TaxID=1962908 RepID=UPI00391F5DF6
MNMSRPARALRHAAVTMSLLGSALATTPAVLPAQWSTVYEQFYLQAPHNWQFRTHYAHADRLFNAFDFGHAILYETLWRFPDKPAEELEVRRYDQLVKRVLPKPPRLPLDEGAIEPKYAQLAPEAKVMFDWAHLLHRQLYDVLADERLDWPRKDAEVARLLTYYRTRPELAFSRKPKTMALMQEQSYSLAFRKKYPKFNGLIWGYHWLQMGLYEPFMVGRTVEEKQAGVRATVTRFWQMLQDAPRSLPHQMPMTVVVAPRFAERYPEAAIIFDNLHSMHDVVSDILTNPAVPRSRKRAEILLAAQRYRDDTTEVMSVPAWRVMSEHMGAENMGGPAVGFLPALPIPSVTYGAVMRHDAQSGAMIGFGYGSAIGDAHAGHNMVAMPATPVKGAAADPHAGHAAPTASDSAQVAALVAGFHEALAQGDSTAALALLTPDVVIVESGAVESLAEYRAHHLPADVAFARAVKAERAPRQVTVAGDVAYSVATWASRGPLEARAADAAGAELIVARHTAAGWRIAAIHWSAPRPR